MLPCCREIPANENPIPKLTRYKSCIDFEMEVCDL